MKAAIQDISEELDKRLTEFEADGENLHAEHEFIANVVGLDDVLRPAYEQLVALGFQGDSPDSGGWIYMHVWRPLTRESVLQLAEQLDDVARSNNCLFELLDVSLTSDARKGEIVILGVCDGEAFENA